MFLALYLVESKNEMPSLASLETKQSDVQLNATTATNIEII
jgi:hypothetical protein